VRLMEKAAMHHGPVYIRFTRDPIPVIYGAEEDFTIGVGKLHREGKDLYVVATGDLLHQGVRAVQSLAGRGIDAGLVDIHTIKPIDKALISHCIHAAGKIITVEDHNVHGGLGSAVSEIAAELGKGKVMRLGLQDTFAECGKYEQLLSKYGMDEAAITNAAFDIMA